MIEGATYILDKSKMMAAMAARIDTNFSWDKITLVERRVSSTETFPKAKLNGEMKSEHTVTRTNYEWVVFTHSEEGFVAVDQGVMEDEFSSGVYELQNWRFLRNSFPENGFWPVESEAK